MYKASGRVVSVRKWRGSPLFLRMPYEYQEKVIMTPTRYEAGEALPVDCCL